MKKTRIILNDRDKTRFTDYREVRKIRITCKINNIYMIRFPRSVLLIDLIIILVSEHHVIYVA